MDLTRSLEAQSLLVARHRRLRGHAGHGEPRIGDQVAVGADDQVRGAGDGAPDRLHEVALQVDRRAEGAHVPAADVEGRDAGRGDAAAAVGLDQPLKRGAAGRSRGVGRRHGDLDDLLAPEVQVRRRVMAVEHQAIGPVGAEHHQPIVWREEVEVVVVPVERFAEVGRHVVGRDEDRLVQSADVAAVGDEGAEPMDEPAARPHPAVEVLGPGAAGAVRLQRILRVEQPRRLGGREALQPRPQGVGRGRMHAPQLRETLVFGLGPLGHIGLQAGDLAPLQIVLEHQEGGQRREHADRHGHHAHAQQEFAGDRVVQAMSRPRSAGSRDASTPIRL